MGLSGSKWVSMGLNISLQGLAGLCGYRYINGSRRVGFGGSWYLKGSLRVFEGLSGSRWVSAGLDRSTQILASLGGSWRISEGFVISKGLSGSW